MDNTLGRAIEAAMARLGAAEWERMPPTLRVSTIYFEMGKLDADIAAKRLSDSAVSVRKAR